jgi:hypothetical protein
MSADALGLVMSWMTVRDLAHLASSANRSLHAQVQKTQARRYERVLLRFPGWATILDLPQIRCFGRSVIGSVGACAEIAELVQLEYQTQDVRKMPLNTFPPEVRRTLPLLPPPNAIEHSNPPNLTDITEIFRSVQQCLVLTDDCTHLVAESNSMSTQRAITNSDTVKLRDLDPCDIWYHVFSFNGTTLMGLVGRHMIPQLEDKSTIRRAFLLCFLASSSWHAHIVNWLATWFLLPCMLARFDCWDACRFAIEHVGAALYRTQQTGLGEIRFASLLEALHTDHTTFVEACTMSSDEPTVTDRAKLVATWVRVTFWSKCAQLLLRTAHLSPSCWAKSTNPYDAAQTALLFAMCNASWMEARASCGVRLACS